MHKTLGIALALALLAVPALASARSSHSDAIQLACAPAYPVISLGNAGRFVAVTNIQGPFEWVASEGALVDAGEVFVAPMQELGPQEVSVIYGSVRATCYVRVVPEPGYGEVTPYSGYGGYFNTPLNVTLNSVLYPFLPNTGFEPVSMAVLASVLSLLLAVAIALYPHVRKAFAIVLR